MTSRVTVLLALVALAALAPVALSTAARSRAAARSSADTAAPGDVSLQQAAADAAASTKADAPSGSRGRPSPIGPSAPRRPAPSSSTRAVSGARAPTGFAVPRSRSQAPAFGVAAAARQGFAVARMRGAGVLRSRPSGPIAAHLAAGTEFGSPQMLSVVRRRAGWLGVVSTALPNGKLGWLHRDDRALSLKRVRYSLHADLSARSLELRRGGRRIARIRVAVGRPGSATPTGRFAVTDKISGSRFGPYYGCCILALSGHQPNTPAGWRGGDRLAIHGTNAPASVGQASSAGCLRAADRDLAVLMRRVPLGTPVFIRS